MDNGDEDLVALAAEALKGAWAPYSGFSVGAALRAESGRIYTGANVENASYGLTMCAERVAVFKAVTSGDRAFREIAVVVDAKAPFPPCGACLQVLREFGPDLKVVLGNRAGNVRRTRLRDLLPGAFGPSHLAPEEGP